MHGERWDVEGAGTASVLTSAEPGSGLRLLLGQKAGDGLDGAAHVLAAAEVTAKVGVAPTPESGEWGLDGRPATLRAQVEQVLRRLRDERIELLQLHRIDPESPLADQLGTLRELQTEGKIGRIGLSEVTTAALDRALEIIDVSRVQNRCNLLDLEHEPVLEACEAAGSPFCPGAPSRGERRARGPRSPQWPPRPATPHTSRPRLASRAFAGHPPDPGTARIDHLEENPAAAGLDLTSAQRHRLERLLEKPDRTARP